MSDISLSKKGTALLIHIASKASHIYLSSKTNIYLIKGWNKQSKNTRVGRLQTIQKTDTLLIGLQITLVMLHAEKLVILVTNHFWYGPADK